MPVKTIVISLSVLILGTSLVADNYTVNVVFETDCANQCERTGGTYTGKATPLIAYIPSMNMSCECSSPSKPSPPPVQQPTASTTPSQPAISLMAPAFSEGGCAGSCANYSKAITLYFNGYFEVTDPFIQSGLCACSDKAALANEVVAKITNSSNETIYSALIALHCTDNSTGLYSSALGCNIGNTLVTKAIAIPANSSGTLYIPDVSKLSNLGKIFTFLPVVQKTTYYPGTTQNKCTPTTTVLVNGVPQQLPTPGYDAANAAKNPFSCGIEVQVQGTTNRVAVTTTSILNPQKKLLSAGGAINKNIVSYPNDFMVNETQEKDVINYDFNSIANLVKQANNKVPNSISYIYENPQNIQKLAPKSINALMTLANNVIINPPPQLQPTLGSLLAPAVSSFGPALKDVIQAAISIVLGVITADPLIAIQGVLGLSQNIYTQVSSGEI